MTLTMQLEMYRDTVSGLVDKANDKRIQSLQRFAYERLIFLLLQKECGYVPKRFVESRLFATLGLKPHEHEKLACLKHRLSDLNLGYDNQLRTMSEIANRLQSIHWEDVISMEIVIPSQHTRTRLYNQGAKMGIYGSRSTLLDFLQRCTQWGAKKDGIYTYIRRQDGFLASKGTGPELVKQIEHILAYYGIDPHITAMELEYLSTL